ncbi:MAG: plasmid pRiA4b ORF-3 family protein, partial [Proteobacteria bacterium]|nr:plasmid pRiA4b ORF-3 family protein [Pseudomonadota bacterium]
RVEDGLEREAGKVYPICIAGARAGPPEDIGGPRGYEVLIHRLRFGDVERLFGDDEEDIGEDDDDPLRVFEPERFSRREVNAALRREFSETSGG